MDRPQAFCYININVCGSVRFQGCGISCVIRYVDARDGNSRFHYDQVTRNDGKKCEERYFTIILIKCALRFRVRCNICRVKQILMGSSVGQLIVGLILLFTNSILSHNTQRSKVFLSCFSNWDCMRKVAPAVVVMDGQQGWWLTPPFWCCEPVPLLSLIPPMSVCLF